MAYNANDRSWYAVLLRFVLTLGLLNAVSCVASELHVCATERGEVLCEPDAVCMPFGCVPQSAVVACANLGAEAMCQVGAVQGRCFAGACITVICGDGLQGATEACDDGNTTDGDGCSANCASNETCGNGVLDPGEACDDANLADDDGCHANCEIPRCGDGIIDAAFGEQCDAGTTNSDAPDAPCRLNCQLPRCGDGIADPSRSEQCDDGNFDATDRCHPDCQLPRCGDGIVDVGLGEQCDPNPLQASAADSAIPGLSHDGCTAMCLLETPSWQEIQPGLTARSNHTLVSDPVRQRVVLFGGDTRAGLSDETWEFDGETWARIATTHGPSPRAGASAAYDASRQVVVLFGGRTNSGRSTETWEYDGVDWRQRQLVHAPPATGAIVYSPALQKTIFFGGANGETWAYDGADWEPVTTSIAPSAREGHQLVYDGANGRIVLFGGNLFNQQYAFVNDTWTFTASGWLQLTSTSSPAARSLYTITYDEQRQRVVLFAGQPFYRDTWELDAAQWVRRTTVTSPLGRRGSAMAYAHAGQRPLLFGGFAVIDGGYELSDETWLLQSDWQRITTTPLPPPRYSGGMAYDRLRNVMVVFGGYSDGSSGHNTWEFDGYSWKQVLGPQPPLRHFVKMVYADHLQAIIMYGGEGHTDTWRYDATGWQLQFTPQRPDATSGFDLTYDLHRQRVVLFGGDDGNFAYNDLWEFDGTTWTMRAEIGAPRPAPRQSAAIAYDASRRVLVMFGGYAYNDDGTQGNENDTWEFDGTLWRRMDTASPVPPKRVQGVLKAVPELSGVVLFSGFGEGVRLGDTWLYQAQTWRKMQTAVAPAARNAAAMDYDQVLGRLIAHNGWAITGQSNDTWAFSVSNASAPRDACRNVTEDSDGDGRVGCGDATHPADPDCWGRCTPFCPPTSLPLVPASAAWPAGCRTDQPRCGDGVCNPALEDRALCPTDCL